MSKGYQSCDLAQHSAHATSDTSSHSSRSSSLRWNLSQTELPGNTDTYIYFSDTKLKTINANALFLHYKITDVNLTHTITNNH